MGMKLRKRRDGTVMIESEVPQIHHFATAFVLRAATEGWLSLGGGQVVLHTADGDVTYGIGRGPGAYCVDCGDRVGEGPATSLAAVEARQAILDVCAAGGSGVEVIDYFDTTLIDDGGVKGDKA